jgi:hypothetical protein
MAVTSAPRNTSWRFGWAFLLTALGILVAVGALNWWVDPYFHYGTGLLPALVDEPRRDKIALLDKLDPPPDVLIYGSSRVRMMDPGLIEDMTGLPAFNATLNQAIPADFYALTRYMIEARGYTPRLIIVGVDIHGFAPDAWMTPAIIEHTPLALYLRTRDDPGTLQRTLDRIHSVLSLQQATDSLRSLRLYYSEGFEGMASLYNEAGFILSRQGESDTDPGSGLRPGDLSESLSWHIGYFKDFDRLDSGAVKDFEAFLQLCSARRIQLILFLPPFHPGLLSSLQDQPDYNARVADLTVLVDEWADQYPFEFYDFSDITSFGGDRRNFDDGHHPGRYNMRLITEALFVSMER